MWTLIENWEMHINIQRTQEIQGTLQFRNKGMQIWIMMCHLVKWQRWKKLYLRLEMTPINEGMSCWSVDCYNLWEEQFYLST